MVANADLGASISKWIKQYAKLNDIDSLIIGVSGGIDSAVTSTLCAMTGLQTIVINMPINQNDGQFDLSKKHIEWLKSNWPNVRGEMVDLTSTYEDFTQKAVGHLEISPIALANTRARLRMTTLYAISASNNGIVVGTGNKVEDFGVGFYTKYGDGGVDISPIADLLKSEVYGLANRLNIIQEIRDAQPTDGLWDDGRTDSDQIGATYDELEWAMKQHQSDKHGALTKRQEEIMEIYLKFNRMNSHKMNPIPIFKKDENC